MEHDFFLFSYWLNASAIFDMFKRIVFEYDFVFFKLKPLKIDK